MRRLLLGAALLAAATSAEVAIPSEVYFSRVPPTWPDRSSRGATHVAEVPYLFDSFALPNSAQVLGDTVTTEAATLPGGGDAGFLRLRLPTTPEGRC
jgi:hypothetical protein